MATPGYSRVLAVPALELKATADPEGGRYIEGWASTLDVDETQEIIRPEAFEAGMQQYMKHPVVSWNHDWQEPIGKVTEYEIVGDRGLYVKARLLSEGATELADKVYALVREGVVRAFSVGFDAKGTKETPPGHADEDSGVWVWDRIQLREIAVTPLPANYEATIQTAKGLNLSLELPGARTKSVVPFQDLATAPENREWDATAAEKRVRSWAGGPDKEDIDWAKYRTAFVWYDADDAENLGAYKLGIADVLNGSLKVVWRGVAAAMGALLGARGGVDIPAADEEGVYNHLKRYYAKFEKEPPEKALSLSDLPDDNETKIVYEEDQFNRNANTLRSKADAVRSIVRHWHKEGRLLTGASRERLEEAHGTLDEVLRLNASLQGDGVLPVTVSVDAKREDPYVALS